MSIDRTRSVNLVISSSNQSVLTLSSSITAPICNFLIPNARGTNLLVLQRSPSHWIVRTHSSILAISVSSSQGLTSRSSDDLAITACLVAFFAWYAANLSSLIFFCSSPEKDLMWRYHRAAWQYLASGELLMLEKVE